MKHSVHAMQKNTLKALLLATAFSFVGISNAHAVDALTTPTGEVVVGGAATFDRPSEGTLNINQSTNRAVINWDNFDTGADATTQFFQPSSSSLAVNRVVGGIDPTQILGSLKANGKIMVLDPNGVFFGPNSKVDVGAVIASTGDISNAQAMSNSKKIDISNFGDGTVENQGIITVADSGLAAFVAPTVQNSGTINAKLGDVVMASGKKATLDLYGDGLVNLTVDDALDHALLENSGQILAEGGNVTLSTKAAKGLVDNLINTSGIIDVSSATVDGGKIILSGANETKVDGDLKASGLNKAGTINVQGATVDVNGDLSANTTAAGKGGTVSVNGDAVTIAGNLLANGETGGGKIDVTGKDSVSLSGDARANAKTTGKGGDITVSSNRDLDVSGKLAANGKNGAGGNIRVKGDLASLSGDMSAQSDTGKGGTINVAAATGVIGGNLNASGDTGGGNITVLGNDVFFDADSSLKAKANTSGKGGSVNLLSTNTLSLNGDTNVSGAAGGGNVNAVSDTIFSNGNIKANSVTSGNGGTVAMMGNDIYNTGGSIQAKGYAKGGNVLAVGRNLTVAGDIDTSSTTTGKGGTVFLAGSDFVSSTGKITSTGGATSGNGGHVFITSPNDTTDDESNVDVSSPTGTAGTYNH